MITIIFGAPGAGKSSLNTYLLKETYEQQGRTLLKDARSRITALNKKQGKNYSLPQAPPIYADYDVRLHVGYRKYYEPYYINGFYMGLANGSMNDQLFVPPHSRIFLSEVQRYYNSRKSQTLPDWVSRFYEMHRHFGIEIVMDLQRPALVDLNIRELCRRFIEVQDMVHRYDDMGNIRETVFRCREFDHWLAVEQYLKNGDKTYRESVYRNEGDIFSCFNSYSCFDEFLPPEGKDFCYPPSFRRANESGKVGAIYQRTEPKEYRSK